MLHVYCIDWTWLWLVVSTIVHSLQTGLLTSELDISVIIEHIYIATNDCLYWCHVMWTIQSADIRGVTSFPADPKAIFAIPMKKSEVYSWPIK